LSKKPVVIVAGVLAAAAFAIPMIGEFEGTVKVGYRDPVGIATSCVGHTGPDAVVGRKYTDEECAAQLANDAVKHGLEIAPCLPDVLPVETRAAFTSFAFNVGTAGFCRSTLAAKAKAGDLRGACAGPPPQG
jgi:lysozyme